MTTTPDPADAADALGRIEEQLLGERPALTRVEVAERAGIDVDRARHLWRLLGFAETDDVTPAFTSDDVLAVQHTQALVDLGILDPEREDALIRTWARSFARLAEWQTTLLTDVAVERGIDPADGAAALAELVIPRVEELQSIIWRRHLMNATSRVLVAAGGDSTTTPQGVCFVDIVGYTSRSKTLTERELVAWLEGFESTALEVVVAHGGRIIKNIGDELLIVTDAAADCAAIAADLVGRGTDPEDPFPEVRAGVAFGDVVLRLGDVYGPIVNIAARLTSSARPGTVLIDEGTYTALTGHRLDGEDDADPPSYDGPYRFRRIRRLSVKGYARLRAWTLRTDHV